MLKSELDVKLNEIYKLRSEIAAILKKNNVKKEDLDIARRKAIELQMLVTELQNQNVAIEEEKKQITAMLDKVMTRGESACLNNGNSSAVSAKWPR